MLSLCELKHDDGRERCGECAGVIIDERGICLQPMKMQNHLQLTNQRPGNWRIDHLNETGCNWLYICRRHAIINFGIQWSLEWVIKIFIWFNGHDLIFCSSIFPEFSEGGDDFVASCKCNTFFLLGLMKYNLGFCLRQLQEHVFEVFSTPSSSSYASSSPSASQFASSLSSLKFSSQSSSWIRSSALDWRSAFTSSSLSCCWQCLGPSTAAR